MCWRFLARSRTHESGDPPEGATVVGIGVYLGGSDRGSIRIQFRAPELRGDAGADDAERAGAAGKAYGGDDKRSRIDSGAEHADRSNHSPSAWRDQSDPRKNGRRRG